MYRFLLSMVLLCCSIPIGAKTIVPMSFLHENWELYCSNTGTCQAAGIDFFNNGQIIKPASILLTRRAGANQAVIGQWTVAKPEDTLVDYHFIDWYLPIYLYLDQQNLGQVKIKDAKNPWDGYLSQKQIDALLANAKQNSQILLSNGHQAWIVSDKGMAAVLLKMDEFQKRLGTKGALIQKGSQDESQVLAAAPRLLIHKVKFSDKPYLTLKPNAAEHQRLKSKLRAALPKGETCDNQGSASLDWDVFELYRLSPEKSLVVTPCWQGAYSEGLGAWVINASQQGKAQFISMQITQVDQGELVAYQKVHGGGGIWSFGKWIWDGVQFIQSESMWTGMSPNISFEGVWQLHLIEADVMGG